MSYCRNITYKSEETGLYYYGAWICRFVSVDPLQFDYPQLTPYNYAGNNSQPHININPKISGKPDPHIPISTNTLKGLETAGKTLNIVEKVAKPLAIATDVIIITDAVMEDDNTFGVNTSKAVGGVAGSWAGALGEAVAGSKGGALIGTLIFPGIGTAIGGFVGGLFGGIVGGLVGNSVGETAGEVIYNELK